jgi:hypothetical protein
MMKHKTVIVGALALAFAPAVVMADDDNEIPFDVAQLFFELNNTDGDLGIHGKIDGGPWLHIQIEDPNERRIMAVRTRGRMRRQALTELSFESAEPPFGSDDPDEITLTPEEFFKRFPVGTYEVEGWSQEGEELESETKVTHLMPAPADGIKLNNVDELPIMKERCDDEDMDNYNPVKVPTPDGTVTIDWEPVMKSHPTIGTPKHSMDIVIHNYEVVVEVEDDNEFVTVFSVILSPEQTAMTVPPEVIALGDTFKYEILTREESYNQTAVESCFELAD